MKTCYSNCSFVAVSARLARPSSSRVRIVQSIGNTLTLSALNAFRIRLEQISIVYERNFPRNTKGGLTTRLLLKNIRVFVVVVLFRRCCCCCCRRGKLFVSLSLTMFRDHLWGETSRANFPQKKRALCSLLRCFCRCLTNGGGV